MRNKFLSTDAGLEKDRFKVLEMRKLNDTEKIYLTGLLHKLSFSRGPTPGPTKSNRT